MALASITFAHSGLTTIDLNNGTTHWVDEDGMNLGQPQTTWEEQPSYAGTANVQTNVQRKALIPVTLPMIIKGSSLSDLENASTGKLPKLWEMVEACTTAAPGTLTVDTIAYSIVYSTRPDMVERDGSFQSAFIARFTLVLTRTP